MTCTHAALARRQLVAMRFTYDTLIMEEAAQILEVETFVPMVLQQADSSGNPTAILLKSERQKQRSSLWLALPYFKTKVRALRR